MAIHLPRPIEIYFESDKARDTEALATCFAADATVHDEDRTHEGLAAIKAWKSDVGRKYEYTVEPLQAAQRDGKTVVTARVAGSFPGSLVTLAFISRSSAPRSPRSRSARERPLGNVEGRRDERGRLEGRDQPVRSARAAA